MKTKVLFEKKIDENYEVIVKYIGDGEMQSCLYANDRCIWNINRIGTDAEKLAEDTVYNFSPALWGAM